MDRGRELVRLLFTVAYFNQHIQVFSPSVLLNRLIASLHFDIEVRYVEPFLLILDFCLRCDLHLLISLHLVDDVLDILRVQLTFFRVVMGSRRVKRESLLIN